MSTAPFQSDTPVLLQETHGQRVAARATHPDFTGAIDLDVIGDACPGTRPRPPAFRVPWCAAFPMTRTPWTRWTLALGSGWKWTPDIGAQEGEDDVQTVADLALRNRRVNRPRNTVTLTVASDEALVIDAAPVLRSDLSRDLRPRTPYRP